ncbi:MAG: MFS transporter [Lentisphaerota bacterium]
MKLEKWYPVLISLPSLGIGVYWSLAGTFAPWLIYNHTESAGKVLLLVAMGPFTGIFVQYLSGIISDRTTSRFGKRTPWILAGLFVACVSQIMWAFAPNYTVLFIVGFITYFAVNFYQGPYYTMIYEVVPKDKIGFVTFFSRFMCSVGGILIAFLSARIWEAGGPMWACIAVAVLLAAPTLIVIPFLVKEKPNNYTTSEKFVFKFDLFKHKSATQLFVAVLFLYLAMGPVQAIMTPYFVKLKGFDIKTLSNALTIGGIIGVIAVGLLSKVIDRFNPKRFFQGVIIFDVLVFGFGSLIESSVPAFYVYNVLIGIMALSYPIMYTLLPRVAPHERLGEFQGLLNSFLSLGDFTMTVSNGYLISTGHPGVVFKLQILFVIIAFLIMLPNYGTPYHNQPEVATNN